MTLPGDVMRSVDTWTDLSGFKTLQQSAQADAKSALPVVAKQFESIFTQMMLKSMRDASGSDGLFDSQASNTWREMFDQQLSLNLSQHGKGLGIAQMLVRQLGGASSGTDAAATPTADDWQQRLGSVMHAAGSVAEKAVSWLPEDAQAFVRDLAPQAAKVAKQLGVSVRAVLAQAALETQWGQHMPQSQGKSSNNLFGMKAGSSWDGAKVNVPTLEFEDGVAVRRNAQFRAYKSPADSLADYARLITDNPRYAQALGHGDDVLGFAKGLVNGGYATDPSYAHKLAAIANSPQMRQALDALKKVIGAPIPSE
ncbi:flagellar assembly peptidoglycan hydrolase FlgJ [Dyella subtropica]|uniref:flagellar assembly peptidoglycan hydrolase FlgJ n=1 Tax=Dyella subtropica TaxID=2992127 RepID=UPI002256E4B2|nr:flagellar assembly peptidoglycan hydrolase FlgJ [Dyella subtropica]